jgi:hypothetical protein
MSRNSSEAPESAAIGIEPLTKPGITMTRGWANLMKTIVIQ